MSNPLVQGEPGQSVPAGFSGESSDQSKVTPSVSSLPLWTRRFIGKSAIRYCRSTPKPCAKVDCWAQPFCACARADWGAARKTEGRIWAIIAGCGAMVLVIALARALSLL